MAVMFKKKAETEPPKEEMSERHKQTLIDAGLLEAEVPKMPVKSAPTWEGMLPPMAPVSTPGKVESVVGQIDAGKRVVITNSVFDAWLGRYKAGDTGTVLRVWSAVPEATGKFRSGIAEIQLDKTREAGHGVCLLHCWELGLVPA